MMALIFLVTCNNVVVGYSKRPQESRRHYSLKLYCVQLRVLRSPAEDDDNEDDDTPTNDDDDE